ncbi:MAG: ATP-binding protein, partial [Candidatus Odinarchaeota archaeon]
MWCQRDNLSIPKGPKTPKKARPRHNSGENELFEVIVNLIKNAGEALLPRGGEIKVRTATEGGNVVLHVEDNGVGIPKKNLDRVFSPFFTTKGLRGTGMGLASSYGIVLRHGGMISVESQEGHGTTFTVKLPLVEDKDEESQAGVTVLPRQLRILVIDDSEPIVRMLRGGLERFGQKVFTATSGDKGTAVFEQESPDLVICDLGMPGMNGWEVGKKIKEVCSAREAPKPSFIM